MNPLRESCLITENEHNFDSLFAKINLYNYQRVHSRGRLNESRFNAKNDIRLTLSEQQCVKDFFKIVEYKMLQSYENRMNEGIDFNIGAKVKKIHNKEILSRIKIRLRNHRTMEEIAPQTIIPKRTNDNRLTVPTLSHSPINISLNSTTIKTNRTNKGTAKSLSNGIKSSGIGLKARKTKVSTLMTR